MEERLRVEEYIHRYRVWELFQRHREGKLKFLNQNTLASVSKWDQKENVRFICNILSYVPFPSICMDCRKDDLWVIIDGNSRMHAIFSFMKVEFDLQMYYIHSEDLRDCKNKYYSELHGKYRRRIETCWVNTICIHPDTTDKMANQIISDWITFKE